MEAPASLQAPQFTSQNEAVCGKIDRAIQTIKYAALLQSWLFQGTILR
jgi:hypothetical protein